MKVVTEGVLLTARHIPTQAGDGREVLIILIEEMTTVDDLLRSL